MKWLMLITTFIVFLFSATGENNETNSSSLQTFKWIKEDRPNRHLATLLRAIDSDVTLLCKDRLEIDALKSAIVSMRKVPIVENKLEVERLADGVLRKYIYLKNHGCYYPGRFLTKDEYARPGKKPETKIVVNPVLQNLEKAFYKYRKLKLAGGWKKIVVKDELYLRPGKSYPEIPAIKERLKAEGYYDKPLDDNTTYDAYTQAAVIDFQRHHGLKPDGVIGPATIDAMNVSVDEKLEKILINIERFRWFMQDDDFFVFVNIPGFFLKVFDNGRQIFESKVVVGRKKRPTPLMRDEIAYAVLNPYWRAPKTIVREDILPYLKRGDFEHLRKKGIMASTDYMGREIVNFEDVDWSQYNEETVPFYFFQTSGPHNFLGYLKLIFPNRFDVYLHDTNHRNLFKYNYRALSSGCVRVQKPIELFHLLKKRESNITCRDIFDIIWSKRTKKIGFKEKIPVYLSYLTVYMDENGEVYFYNDVYGYDKRMKRVLKRDDNRKRPILEAKW